MHIAIIRTNSSQRVSEPLSLCYYFVTASARGAFWHVECPFNSCLMTGTMRSTELAFRPDRSPPPPVYAFGTQSSMLFSRPVRICAPRNTDQCHDQTIATIKFMLARLDRCFGTGVWVWCDPSSQENMLHYILVILRFKMNSLQFYTMFLIFFCKFVMSNLPTIFLLSFILC